MPLESIVDVNSRPWAHTKARGGVASSTAAATADRTEGWCQRFLQSQRKNAAETSTYLVCSKHN